MNDSELSVVLASGGIATDAHRAAYRDAISEAHQGIEEVLFIPWAAHDHDGYTERMNAWPPHEGHRLVGIHTFDDPALAVREAQAICIGGGNSFLLIRALHRAGIIHLIRDRVLQGMPYSGASAGANVACPTMQTTNDMPIVHPPSFDALGIVPFQINPHHHPGKIRFEHEGELLDHHGETRAKRIEEYHREADLPVIGLWEGAVLRWDGRSAHMLHGRGTILRKGESSMLVEAPCILDGSLHVR